MEGVEASNFEWKVQKDLELFDHPLAPYPPLLRPALHSCIFRPVQELQLRPRVAPLLGGGCPTSFIPQN
jgi:hypothetical protein